VEKTFDTTGEALCCAASVRLGGALRVLAARAGLSDRYDTVMAGMEHLAASLDGGELDDAVLGPAFGANWNLGTRYPDDLSGVEFFRSGLKIVFVALVHTRPDRQAVPAGVRSGGGRGLAVGRPHRLVHAARRLRTGLPAGGGDTAPDGWAGCPVEAGRGALRAVSGGGGTARRVEARKGVGLRAGDPVRPLRMGFTGCLGCERSAGFSRPSARRRVDLGLDPGCRPDRHDGVVRAGCPRVFAYGHGEQGDRRPPASVSRKPSVPDRCSLRVARVYPGALWLRAGHLGVLSSGDDDEALPTSAGSRHRGR
jgi:hypothetical protein